MAPIGGVGREHPLSVEKLFPVLAVYRAKSTDEALRVCMDVNHAGGLGHTAVIFSRNEAIIRKFSEMMDAGRIIANSPGSIGALGGVYNDMVPTFSFGCGTGGGNSTTDNVNLYHYLNIKRVARRTQAHMWFRVPNQIYFNMNAVENLRQFPSRATLIVTNPMLEQMGHVAVVRRAMPEQTLVRVLAIPDAEPELKVVMQGVEALNLHQADQIVALGGGSVIDAAKIMKLKYESPEADIEELAAPFLDIRKRVVQYPAAKANPVRLIAISTTSGTGSEVTPFAVLIDKEHGRKVTLADYSLSPDVAIVDPQFVMSMPKGLTADTGIDCLTHALEAGVSIHASPYTDSNAMQAIRLVFRYLPTAYEQPGDEEARSMMHNAACIAALAFSNASVGVNHALAHAFGARFGVSHGKANALMLPHVIHYNASVPSKFMPSPNQRAYVAHKKYAAVADLLNLGGDTVAEKVANLVAATSQLLDRLGIPRSIAELGIARGGIRARHTGPGQGRVRRPLLALQPADAAGERTDRIVLERIPGAQPGGSRTGERERMVACMTENRMGIKIDPEHVAHSLRQEAVEQLGGAANEIVLDFGAVARIDANAIRALEELSGLADERSVRVVLRGVNMDIYKVLKLVDLAARFGFEG